MRVLITGGSGFINTNWFKRVIAHCDKVLSLDIVILRNSAQLRVYFNAVLGKVAK